jgi:hypothetical protein
MAGCENLNLAMRVRSPRSLPDCGVGDGVGTVSGLSSRLPRVRFPPTLPNFLSEVRNL